METIDNIRAITNGLVYSTIGFCLLAVCLLLFILCFLLFFKRKSRKDQQLADRFYTLVGEISLCESDAEREEVINQAYVQELQRTCLHKRRRRSYMLKALVQFHKSIHGVAADNTKWLYEKLDLKKDSLQQLASSRWHKKAAAIQLLADMGQQDCIAKIYRYTNHANYYIRSAAQVAVVKLTGVEGLRFLNVTNQPITQWQQICLMQQLSPYANIPTEKLHTWLSSENETVVALALKLVKAYVIHEVHDRLIQCLQHPNVQIRTAVIEVLTEVFQPESLPVIKVHYAKAERSERLAILKLIQVNGSIADVSFLETLLDTLDKLLKNEVLKTIKEIAPNWTFGLNTAINNNQNSILVV
ncbi:MAG TPA: hypothetical protein VD794_13855 [Flavisolibacter sp.]|nr:hypothetical protein [Flavisolibacter sp.]